MRNVNFVFSSNIAEGGKVFCTDAFCTKNVLDTFQMTDQLIHGLFSRGLKGVPSALMQTEEELLAEETSKVFMGNRRKMQEQPESGRLQ